MKLALDTNRYSDFARGDEYTVSCIRQARIVAMPLIVLAELRAGFACGTRSKENEKNLTLFLNSERVKILYPDDETTHHYARIFHQLKNQGTPIPTNDIWIASLVTQHELVLLARDKHFEQLPQIARI